MSDVLTPIHLSVDRHASGGVKLQLGSSMGILSPEEAFELATVILKKIGVGVDIGGNVQPLPKHFRAG
jgi:hypothetical protein